MDEGQITKRARRSPTNRSPSLIITHEYTATNSDSGSAEKPTSTNHRSTTNLDITISSTDDSKCESNNVSVTVLSDSLDKSDPSIDYSKTVNIENKKEDFQWIAPQFKDLTLNSSKGKNTYCEENRNPIESKTHIKFVRMYVEALCCKVNDKGEILSLDCQIIREADMPGESDSSGYAADVSKTVSPLSGASATYIPPLHGSHTLRASIMSHSSSSSVPSSAAALHIQNLKKSALSFNIKEYTHELESKWKNYDLVYCILKAIDDSFNDHGLTTNIIEKTEKQNHFDYLESEQVSPKKRTSVTLADKEPEAKKAKIEPTPGEDNLLVFAKWTDQRYYAGYVKGQTGDRWNIEFLDGSTRNVTDEQIIFADVNRLIGFKVMVTDDTENVTYPGIVTAFSPGEEPMYTVATDRGDFTVSANNIYLTKHQAKQVKTNLNFGESNSLSSSSLSTRTTRSRTAAFSPKPCSSGTQKAMFTKTLEMKITSKSTSELSTTTDEDASECAANGGIVNVPGCDVEMRYQRMNNPSIKLKRSHGQSSKSTIEKEASTLGPLDNKGTWFKGLGFLLTCGSRPFCDVINEDDDITDCEDYPFTTVPYVEDHLINQIKNGCGTVYLRFEDIPPKKYKTVYLISWRPALTPKYIRGLAVGMKMVCHEWIVNCSIKQKRVPLQELPAGWSIEDQCFINNFERKSDKPFRNIHIKIAQLSSKLFYDFWFKVCSDAGGTVSAFEGPCENTDFILVENGLTDPSLDAAAAQGVLLVSTTWVIQSLIHGELRNFEKHRSYSHLYDDGEEL